MAAPKLLHDGRLELRWSSVLNRRYALHQTTMDGQPRTLATDIEATPPANAHRQAAPDVRDAYFQVEVEEPAVGEGR
jgi:hypothetical protein